MKLLLLILSLASSFSGTAQVSMEIAPSGTDRGGALMVYGSEGLNNAIPYDKIRGIAYWKTDFLPALLYAPGNKLYGKFSSRINLAVREVEYITKKNETISANPDQLSKVVFTDPNDSTKIITIFRNDIPEINLEFIKRNKKYYAQELNQGPFKLIKVNDKELRVQDSLFHTLKSYRFVDILDYFIQHENRIEKIKKLNREEVMHFLPKSETLDAWIKENDIKFHREEKI
jgi:hypothetical protein